MAGDRERAEPLHATGLCCGTLTPRFPIASLRCDLLKLGGVQKKIILFGEHRRQRSFIGVVPAQQVQEPVASEKEELLRRAVALGRSLTTGRVAADHDVAEFEGLRFGPIPL